MFNIQRYDPSLPSTASTSSTTGLTDLARKIEERQRKRKALDEGPAGDAPEASAAPVVAASVVEEWRPAAGESPAEREKREKREKRAQRMGPGVSFNTVHQGPSGSMYVPPPQAMGGWEKEEGSGVISIHPDRMGAPALKQESKKAEKVYVEKTVAKKNYLKKKRERSKARTKSEAPSLKKLKTSKTTAAAVGPAGEDAEENSDDSDDERDRIEKEEKKRAEIIKKKEERKIKRDEKKAEQRVLKAAGLPPIMPTPRVLPRSAVIAPIVEPTVVVESAEPTAEELELQVFEEEKRARKESKRLKRTTRRHSPPPEPIVAVEAPIDDAPSTLIPTAAAPHLIPTAPSTLIPTAHVLSIPEVESTDVEMAEVAPVEASEPAPKPAVEPSPLYRLPSATRPAPPSAKVLSALNVHESVRAKRIVDPDFRLPFLSTGAKEGEDMRVSERGVKRLAEMGVTEAFAVQTAVLPLLLEGVSALYRPFDPPRDICVSAPTGSGKTLSYVVPIVETLSTRVVTRLRALVLLPTRDLVQQVRETFELFGKGTGLKVGTATGQHSFTHEQVSLVGDAVPAGLQGGSSQVDILIATPGRLMDHIRSTPGFSLQHLRYLVIDEADRLLNQSFHDWLPSILAALKPPASLHASTSSLESGADVLAPEWWDTNVGRVASDVDERSLASCQKLLLSATLSRDPAKIDALHLHRPIFISVEDPLDPDAEDEEIDEELKFTLPATLSEHMIVSPSTHKPLYLFHLLHTLSLDSALCFTKSVEAATRLAKLVELFEEVREAAEPPVVVVEGEEAKEEKKKVVVKSYSSELPPNERTKILASFKKGEIQMLICSDLVSRGIDLPHVSHVISYDVPTDMRKYVHRVGRTARAGKTGDAWSLVEDQEAAPFKAIMNSAQHLAKIKRVRVKDHLVEPFVPHYQVALERLRKHFATGRDQAE